MLILSKKPSKKKFFICTILVALFLQFTFASFSQATDSTDYFFRKGLSEKQNGRRLESLKQFEKAITYDANNKIVLNELALAYTDLRRHDRAIETYKKLIALGEGTAANYKQL